MNDGVRIGELLTLKRRPVPIEATRDYTFLGISGHGGGFFRKQPVLGGSIRPGSIYGINPGDFVYSRLFAWQGSAEIATEKEAGCVVSGEFPTFEIDNDRLDGRWLRFWLLSDAGLRVIADRCAGSTPASRNRLREDRFLDIPISLPSLGEQRRVADHLGRVSSASTRLTGLCGRVSTLSRALGVSASGRPDIDDSEKRNLGWTKVPLGAVLTRSVDSVDVDPGASYPNIGIYSFGRGLFAKSEIDGSRTSAKALNRIRKSQFIYSRLFAFEGAYAFVEDRFDSVFVSNEFPCFDVDQKRLSAQWLANYLRTPDRWAELAGWSKGLGVRRQRVPVDAVLRYQVWLPPLQQQKKVAGWLDALSRAESLRCVAHHRIDALMPAALNEAFAGVS